MKCAPSVAIDLPQKAVIWQNAKKYGFQYNDPAYLKQRDHIQGCDEVPAKVPGLYLN